MKQTALQKRGRVCAVVDPFSAPETRKPRPRTRQRSPDIDRLVIRACATTPCAVKAGRANGEVNREAVLNEKHAEGVQKPHRRRRRGHRIRDTALAQMLGEPAGPTAFLRRGRAATANDAKTLPKTLMLTRRRRRENTVGIAVDENGVRVQRGRRRCFANATEKARCVTKAQMPHRRRRCILRSDSTPPEMAPSRQRSHATAPEDAS
mmetsp:Transcript_62946/g.175351  ORF Transcript_62946/g.175351 Transcript_62946/m.175351 type:complete len:207 (-) Transcript_62946:54-674(-)